MYAKNLHQSMSIKNPSRHRPKLVSNDVDKKKPSQCQQQKLS